MNARPDPFPAGFEDLVTSFPLGRDRSVPPVAAARSAEVVAAIESVLRPALADAGCIIAFSGGRDSSALLSIALRLARREGLDEPIPVSIRTAVPDTQEDEWQERVIAALAPRDWEKIKIGRELEFLYERGKQHLLRHGLTFPANCLLFAPMHDRWPGATVVTGLDGDTVFGGWPAQRMMNILARRQRPGPRDVLLMTKGLMPARVRAEIEFRRRPFELSYLRPGATERLQRRVALEYAREPLRWNTRTAAHIQARSTQHFMRTLQAVADETESNVLHPLSSRPVLAALATAGGFTGFRGRTEAMKATLGSVVPEFILERTSKAVFGEYYFGESARDWSRRWDGSGVDPELIDVEMLRAEWCKRSPSGTSSTLLQHTWLASNGADDSLKSR